MHQYIYALAALGLTMMLSLSLSSGVTKGSQRLYMNEALTQLSGVAYDVLEDIERKAIAFDKRTDESRYSKPIMFPLVRKASELTPKSQFGGCSDYSLCKDVDDYDGMQITRSTQGYDFVIALAVDYVNESDPTQISSSQTFVKRISATVTHPAITINGEPLAVTISRVVTYHRVTEKAGIWL